MHIRYVISLFFVLLTTSLSAQELLTLYEQTDKMSVHTMAPDMAEAVFISNSGDLKITSSNKSIDEFQEPVKIADGKYQYLVKLHLIEGHNVRHFYIQKADSPFKTSTKQKVFFRPGERHYFEVTDPDVKFTLGKDKDAYHLFEGECCIEIVTNLPNLQVAPDKQLPCRISSTATEMGTFVHTIVMDYWKFDSLRNVYENFPDQWEAMVTIPVFFSNSNIAYINVENVAQRIKYRYSVLPIQIADKKSTGTATVHLRTNVAKATLYFNGQEYATENADFVFQTLPGTYKVKIVAQESEDLFYEEELQILSGKLYQEFSCPIKTKSYYNINYTIEKGVTLLLDGEVVKDTKQHRMKVPSGIHLLEVFWNNDKQLNQKVQIDGWEEDVTVDLSLAGSLSFSYPANATFEITPCENAMTPSVKKLNTGEKLSLLGDYDVWVKKKGYAQKHYSFKIGVRDTVEDFVADLTCKADELFEQHMYAKAFKAYQKMAADQRDDHALYQLGECFYNGYGVEQNHVIALGYWEKAANLGNMKAVLRLINEELPVNEKKLYLTIAAEKGIPQAQKQLADLYFYNSELQDYHQALLWYRKACQSIPAAYYQVGEIYQNGLGVTKNVNVAKSQYEIGSRAGDEKCTERLADYMYDEGKTADAVKMYAKLHNPTAISCYRVASAYFADSAFLDAAHWLLKINPKELPHTEEHGRFYCLVANHLYEQDKKLSVNLYEIAVDELNYTKFPKAFFRIGRYYESTDPTKAYQSFMKSASLGDAEAMCRVGYCYEVGLGVRGDYQQALHWYNEAINNNYKKAYRFLGTLYINGNGVDKDEKMAVKYWTIAAKEGDNSAIKLLVQYYKMKRQTKQAQEWERKLK